MCTRFNAVPPPPPVFRLALYLFFSFSMAPHPLPLLRLAVTTSHGSTASELVQAWPNTPPLTATATIQHLMAKHVMSPTWSLDTCASPPPHHSQGHRARQASTSLRSLSLCCALG